MNISKEQFVKGEVVAIYGILTIGVLWVLELLVAFNIINLSENRAYFYFFCSIVSIFLMAYGCFFMAKGKGYNPIIGLLLSLIFIGPMILSYMPYRRDRALSKNV